MVTGHSKDSFLELCDAATPQLIAQCSRYFQLTSAMFQTSLYLKDKAVLPSQLCFPSTALLFDCLSHSHGGTSLRRIRNINLREQNSSVGQKT